MSRTAGREVGESGLAITIPMVTALPANSGSNRKLIFEYLPEKSRTGFPNQWLVIPDRFIMSSQGLSILKVELVSTSFF